MTDRESLWLVFSGSASCGKTYQRSQLVKLEKEIKETIKDLDTYNVSEQIRLSKELVKLFEMKNLLLKL